MVCVIVPAYNEEKNIGRVVRGLFESASAASRLRTDKRVVAAEFKIVVVDDGSTDNTGRLARDAGAVVIRHSLNRGQGAALETGDSYARGQGADAVVHFDADGQFNAADIAPALELMEKEQYDVILGSRFLDHRSRIPWLKRFLILPVSRWINYVFTGLKLTDVHNGFRIFSRRALENIIITQDGMAHNTEIPALIKKNHLRFKEYPVEVTYREMGQGIGGGLKIVSDLLMHKLTH